MTPPPRSLLALACGLGLFGAATCLASKVETWRHDSASAFNRGKKERVVVADNGEVSLSRPLTPVGSLTAARVWDIARDLKGNVYAATGDEGKVFKLVKEQWEVAYDATDTQVLSIAATGDGHVFVGTGPSGLVVDLNDPKKAARPAPGVQYVWDLATDKSGNLYAATGPTGQLWKRDNKGQWSLLLDSKHSHILCVAVRGDGSVFAGTDGEGLIYRVSPDGKVSVVYDAPQSEVRALTVGPDGSVFAGTAVESSGGSGSGRPSSLFGGGTSSLGGSSATPLEASTAKRAADAPQLKENRPADRPSFSGGTAAPKPPSPGENAVYRIGADGVAREILRGRFLVHALAIQGDRLYVGTGPEGILYELRGTGRSTAQVARLDSGQILALADDRDGGLLVGTGDPGTVVRLGAGHVPVGSLTSDVLDAKLISRFGSVNWKADVPRGCSLAVQLRSGQVGEPDETWSPWTAEQALSEGSHPSVPAGRFAQFRVIFRTDDPSITPELRTVALRYQTENLAPEITKLDVPDISAGDGSTKQAKLTVRWDASDPNGDELEYRLFVKKEGWPSWIALTENPVTESKYEWDSTSVPGGFYRVRLVASDRLSNRPEDALTRDRESEPFLIDHEAPKVAIERKGDGPTLRIRLADDATRLTKAAYAIDGGDWRPIFPDDSLFDAQRETITLKLAELKSGTHVVMVRATDAAGNIGTADVVFEAK